MPDTLTGADDTSSSDCERGTPADCVDATESTTHSDREHVPWHFCGNDCPKAEIIFLCQIVVLYTVIVVSIYNLTRGNGDSNLWTALLSSCLGYLLPSPSMRRSDGGG